MLLPLYNVTDSFVWILDFAWYVLLLLWGVEACAMSDQIFLQGTASRSRGGLAALNGQRPVWVVVSTFHSIALLLLASSSMYALLASCSMYAFHDRQLGSFSLKVTKIVID